MIPLNIIRKNELIANIDHYVKTLTEGIYVIPVDTIYGLSCNALKNKIVKKLRKIKKTKQPFSIIPPSKDWILNNCVVDEKVEQWLDKLPGPYTLILKLKNKKAVASSVYNKKDYSIGVRIPDHWITKIIETLNFPIVTTSANISGRNFVISTEDLDAEIRRNIDLVVSVGIKKSRPSTLIYLVNEEKIVKR